MRLGFERENKCKTNKRISDLPIDAEFHCMNVFLQ